MPGIANQTAAIVTVEPYRFDAFISYSHRDAAFARRLHRALTAYHPPRDLRVPQRRLRVFRDESDFQGPEYGAALAAMLESARVLLVICSPNSRRSTYVGDEIERFIALRGPSSIACVLLAGQPNNQDGIAEDDKAFPEALVEQLPVPLAADYRGWHERRDTVDRGRFDVARYKLLADIYAVYGVDRSAIEQRERFRRQRLRRLITAATAALFVVLASLTTWALVSRREAILQRDIARSRFLAAQSASGAHPFDLTLLLAVAAHRTSGSFEAWENLLGVLQRQPQVQQVMHGLPAAAERLYVGRAGGCVAAAVGPRTVFWSRDTPRVPEVLPGHVMPDPSCSLLIGASADGRLDVRPRGGGTVRWTAAGPGSPVSTWAVDAAGATLAVAHENKRLIVYDLRDGRVRAERADEPAPLRYLRFNADGTIVAAVDRAGHVHRWHADGLRPVSPVVPCGVHAGETEIVALSPDMRWCAAGGAGHLALTDVGVGVASTFDLGTPWILSLDFSPDGRTLMAGVQGGALESWTLADIVHTGGKARSISWHEHRADVTAAAYAPDGGVVVSAARDRTLIMWQTAPANRLVSELAHLPDANAIAVDPDTLETAFGTARGDVWRGPASRMVAAGGAPLTSLGQRVTAVALQAGRLVVGTSSGEVVAVDGKTGERRAVRVATTPIVRLRFSPDLSRLAVVSEDGASTLLNLEGWTPVATFAGGAPRSTRGGGMTEAVDVAFARDGRSLVTVHGDSQAFLWDWESGVARFLPVPFRPTSYVSSAAISPDGRMLALGTGIYEGEVMLFNLPGASGPVARLPAHTQQDVTSLAFSPDGRLLVSGGADARIAFWDVAGRRRLGNVHDARGAVSSLAFASDGMSVVAVTDGGDVRRWELQPERWMALACRIANRDLTRDERRRLLDGDGASVCP